MTDDWKRLSEISDWLNNVRKPQWENILIKTSKSYVNASETVEALLPKGHDSDPGWVWSSLKATMKGPLAVMITNPVALGIATYYIIDATKSEREPLPPVPQFGVSPQKYSEFMQFHYNVVFIEASRKILRMQREVRAGNTPDIAANLDQMMRSPLMHEPARWDKFETSATEREIEAGIWAKWVAGLNDHKLNLVARAMGEDDYHNTSGDSKKSDGNFKHLAWQRLKAVGAFEAAYRGGQKRNTHADHDVGAPTASYHFWLKVARETWARNHTPDEYFYVGLTSPGAELFFKRAMLAYQAQDFTDRISFYFSPSWAAIKQLIPAN